MIQHLLTQEVISIHSSPLYKPSFWVRQKTNSQAELDLIYQVGSKIIPFEVKSGSQGKLRSLHQFVERSPHPYAVRFHANNFSVEEVETPGGKPYFLMNLPYYLGTLLPEYVDWFIENYVFRQ